MNEYRKEEDWMNSKLLICYKCSNHPNCMIPVGCEDWKKWYWHSVQKDKNERRKEIGKR